MTFSFSIFRLENYFKEQLAPHQEVLRKSRSVRGTEERILNQEGV